MTTLHDLLTVFGVLAGIGALLVLMSALDPTSDRTGSTSPSPAPGEMPAIAPPDVL